ncbi:MAG: arylsulfatase, partial [Phycisphaeraceae bacterium]|nr:arylsulfatase [Phycisphaeraceae bacterium]
MSHRGLILLLAAVAAFFPTPLAAADRKPNIIFAMLDDAGIGDLGCYGSEAIRTPHIDRVAAEGMRFTQCYSGSAVCAPTRCVLMTGLHPGHCRRRDNTAKAHLSDFPGRPLVFLEPTDRTVSAFLKKQGYVCGGYGKWGLGNPGSSGVPEKHGFDDFYGYYDQVHAHSYYPPYLIRNSQKVPTPRKNGNIEYTHDVLHRASLQFIRQNRDRPFFLYLPYTIPHGKYEVPDLGEYAKKKWTRKEKVVAAMMGRLDRDFGQLMALLKELKIDEHTIVFFTSDNGRAIRAPNLNSSLGLRGMKRSLYEGGLRAPMIVRWPGKIPVGSVSDFVWTHVDFFATAAQVAGNEPPPGLDSRSVLPTLLGQKQKPFAFHYWEIHSPFQQAVRMGRWKGIRFGFKDPLKLYDLQTDEAEKNDVAAGNPQVVRRIEQIMKS